ncbi:hypothetical protein [Bradyrhizobium sp. 25ACV]
MAMADRYPARRRGAMRGGQVLSGQVLSPGLISFAGLIHHSPPAIVRSFTTATSWCGRAIAYGEMHRLAGCEEKAGY